MNIDTLNLKEIKEWVDEEGYLDNVYDPITENTFYWLIRRIEKHEKALSFYADNQHVKKYLRQGKEFREIEDGETARKALEDK